MLKTRALLLSLIALAACQPASARADAYADGAYPGQRLASPEAQALVNGAARGFIVARTGREECPSGITVWQVPSDDEMTDEWATGMACQIWLSRALAHRLQGSGAFEDALQACQALAHETGHAEGLPHSASGLMAGTTADGAPPLPEPFVGAWAPPFCRSWARDLVVSSDGDPSMLRAAVARYDRLRRAQARIARSDAAGQATARAGAPIRPAQ